MISENAPAYQLSAHDHSQVIVGLQIIFSLSASLVQSPDSGDLLYIGQPLRTVTSSEGRQDILPPIFCEMTISTAASELDRRA